MTDELYIGKDLEGSENGLIRLHPSIFLERLMGTTKDLSG
jgi:hypothetical protein